MLKPSEKGGQLTTEEIDEQVKQARSAALLAATSLLNVKSSPCYDSGKTLDSRASKNASKSTPSQKTQAKPSSAVNIIIPPKPFRREESSDSQQHDEIKQMGTGKWLVKFPYQNQSRNIGTFDTREEAEIAHRTARGMLKTNSVLFRPFTQVNEEVKLARSAAMGAVIKARTKKATPVKQGES